MDKKTAQIVCTCTANGRRHDFRLFKESKTHFHPETLVYADTGYQGLQKRHLKTELPKKKTRKRPLTKDDKKKNAERASKRVLCENVMGALKRFKIIADRYRNRRKRFGLRMNLLASIYNQNLTL